MGTGRYGSALTRRADITKPGTLEEMRREIACGQEVPRAGRTSMPI